MGSEYGGSNVQGKGDIGNCSCNRAVKRLEGGGKGVSKRLCRIVIVGKRQFGLMPERGTIGAVCLRCLQEEYCAKGNKLYVFCGDSESF